MRSTIAVDYFASNRQTLRKMSARRAKYLSTKGLGHVVHSLSSDTCTTAVDKDMDSVLNA
jgi:hypothetical protein